MWPEELTGMRDYSTPSLFEVTPANPQLSGPEPPAGKEENPGERLAKDFVRWCFSFGADFRNSPDVTNLRFWARKVKVKVKESEELNILSEARKLYQRRIEQRIKKSEFPGVLPEILGTGPA
jgi:hypothetical protein